MKSEISFLIDLILSFKLPKVVSEAVRDRIREIETNIGTTIVSTPQQPRFVRANLLQAPSILAKYPEMANGPIPNFPDPEPVPVEQIAQTPATAQALADRQALINASMSGKTEPGRTSPRKIGRQ